MSFACFNGFEIPIDRPCRPKVRTCSSHEQWKTTLDWNRTRNETTISLYIYIYILIWTKARCDGDDDDDDDDDDHNPTN